MAVQRDQLVNWLDQFLDLKVRDSSLNGLQLEGKDDVKKVALAVDSTLATIEAAISAGADFLITHHGWFWGYPLAIRGPHGQRVSAAVKAGLSLYVSHLPLDLHPEVGNNVQIAKLLNLENIEPFAENDRLKHGGNGIKIGFKGTLPEKISLKDFANKVQQITNSVCLVHGGGKAEIQTVGIVSGGAIGFLSQAAEENLDVFLTGEPSHANFADPFEYKINAIFAGHYDTETFGVKALGAKLNELFGLEIEFLYLPTGL